MSKFRLFIGIVLILAGLSGAFLYFTGRLTGQDYLKDFVLQQLEESLHRKIDVHRAKFVLFPSIRIELTQVAIHDPNSEHAVLTAKRIDLVLRLLPLLRKQVVGKRLLVEEPTLTLRRNESGHWNVLDGVHDQVATDRRTMEVLGRMFLIKQATLVNGTITIVDAARPGGVRSVTLEHVDAGVLIKPDLGTADVRLSTGYAGDRGASTVAIEGVLRQSEKPVTLVSEVPAEPSLGLQFDGRLEASNLAIAMVADFLGPRPVPEHLRGMLSLKSAVRVMPGVAGYDVVLSDMAATLNDMVVTGTANLAGILTPQPTFTVTFKSSLVSLAQLRNAIPGEWVHPQLPALLEERQIDGKVQIASATLTGATAAGPQLSMTGEFHIQDAQALIGNDRVPAKNLSGVVTVEPGRVRVVGLTGTYGAIQLTDGKAMVSFLDAGPWLELEVVGTMAAADLVPFLAKTIKSDRVAALLAGIRNVEGTAQPTFRLVGALNQPDGVTFAGGEIAINAVSLTHPDLPERMTGLRGRFAFSEAGTKFEQVTGHLGDTVVQAEGIITSGTASQYQDFVVRARGDARAVARAIPGTKIPAGTFEGVVRAAVALGGSTAAPRLRGTVILDETKVTLPGWLEKPAGAPATVEFEADVAKADAVTVTRMELVLPSLRLPAKGVLQLGQRFNLEASVATGTVSLSSLPDWIAKGGFEAGNVEISLDVKGKDPDWKNWRITGWLAMTNGLMTAKGLDAPVQDLYARVKMVRNGAEVKRLSFKIKDSDLAFDAVIRNWATKPVVTGKMESNQLDIDLLIPKGARSPVRDFLETLAATSHVMMSASVVRGHYKQLKLGGLSARVTIQDGVLDIDRVSGQSMNGELAGRAVVQLPRNAPADAEISMRVTGLPFEELQKLTGSDKGVISGDVRLSGTIRGHGRNPHGVVPTLNGKIEVVLEEGHIFKSDKRAVWKILGILNLPAVLRGKVDLEKEGLPYDKMSGTVTIQDGVFQTENMVIDSPILKITAAGNYDMPTDQIDFVAAVSPFGSYSKMIDSIPLFGRLLDGDRKGIATAMFSVKGSGEDPEVTYLPMKSFATGLTGLAELAVDVLKNVLMLPINLMTPEQEKQTETAQDRGAEPAPATP